jgi:hypothetical protein
MKENGKLTEEVFIKTYLTETYNALVGKVAFAVFDMRNGHYMRIKRLCVGHSKQEYRVNYFKMGKEGLEEADWNGVTNNVFAGIAAGVVGFEKLLSKMKEAAAFKRDEYAHVPLPLDILDTKPVNYFEILNAVRPPEPGSVRVERAGQPGKYYFSRKPRRTGCVPG